MLSLELGLLWPTFMAFAGPVIGMPFSLKGFAFFLEAIFLGLSPVRLGRAASAGARICRRDGCLRRGAVGRVRRYSERVDEHTYGIWLVEGKVVGGRSICGHVQSSRRCQVVHMLLAAYAAVGVAVAGIHARCCSHDTADPFHRRAFAIALAVGLPAALVQPVSGDWAGRVVARTQPAKLAALEGQFATEAYAPIGLRYSRCGRARDAVCARDSRRLEL